MTSSFRGLARIDLRPGAPETHAEAWRARTGRHAGLSGDADEVAREIVEAVRRGGDAAVVAATAQFEGRTLALEELEVGAERRASARARVPAEVAAALELAADAIRRFHRTQRIGSSWLPLPEGRLESRVRPLRRVAVYAPGGTASYPSSVLMAGIPAKVAGVPEVILLTPRATDVVLVAADLAGIDRVFEIGGAQAIAAVAFGTESVPRVDKIVGPGNAWVTAAKRRVFGIVDIDGVAGPSEILVLADDQSDPAVVAADLLSQAEHDVLACAVLVTDSVAVADAVDTALVEQLASLPRAEIASAALRDHGASVLVGNRAAMLQAANAYAPEHVELLVRDPESLAEAIHAAGAIFVGPWTPEAAGDYTAGPSHVLPTAGAARFGSPLGVWDFVKYTSVLQLPEAALRAQADAIVTLARAEGLEAHARAVLRRVGQASAASERPRRVGGLPWARHLAGSLRDLSVYDVAPAEAEARLHANECPEPWPAEVMDALAEVVRGIELSRYPDTSGRALRAILGERHSCDPDRIVLGNGSDEVISLLLTALSGTPGARVVVPTPTFVMYGHTARVLGLQVIEVPLDLRFALRESAMHAALEGAALCFLARPNNPTGSLWDREVIDRLVAAHPDVVFVIDEAYGAYAPGTSLFRPDGPHNQVHMSTLSKVGLAALRVGYCIAHPELALALNKVRHPYNISRTSLALAEAVLTRFDDVQAKMVAQTIVGRGRLAAMLAELPGAEVFPSSGNLVLVRLTGGDEPRRLVAFLAGRGVLVKDVSRVPALEGCVRVSVGTSAELDRLDQALAAWALER